MPSLIKYRVPYQVDVHGSDVASGQALLNTFYLRCGLQTATPPAYGQPIAGPSSNVALLTQFRGLYGQLTNLMSVNYVAREFHIRAIMGKRYSSPLQAITGLVTGANPTVQVGSPHHLVSGNVVFLAGITTPASLNGFHTITVATDTSYSLNGAVGTGPWSMDGSSQLASGTLDFLYADLEVLANPLTGVIAGDALPLFATASVRRINNGIGRNFRSRFSLSPFAEADASNGGWLPAFRTSMGTALAAFNTFLPNGGTDAGSGMSFHLAVSKTIAMTLPSPFTAPEPWSTSVTSMLLQPNHGSLLSRKPSLTAVIG